MTDILNPFAEIIASGIEIRNALADSVTQLELAIENKAIKVRTAKELKAIYDEAEAEFVAEIYAVSTATNDKTRKAEQDAALAKARCDGKLARAWAQKNAAAYDLEDAESAFEQCSARFSATRAAAELTAAMLRAAAR